MPLVKPEQVGPCAGTPLDPPCRSKQPLRIRGLDDRWRCARCHAVHVELFYADIEQKDPIRIHDRILELRRLLHDNTLPTSSTVPPVANLFSVFEDHEDFDREDPATEPANYHLRAIEGL